MSWHDLVVDVLNLVDLTLTANLVLIVIFSGYENFVHKIEQPHHDALPGGLTDVDFSALKQKLLGSVVVIAAVDALAWYLDLEKYTDTSKLGWALAFPLMLVLALLMLAAADRLTRHNSRWDAWISPSTFSANARKPAEPSDFQIPPQRGEGLLTIPGVNRASTFCSRWAGTRVCGSSAFSSCCWV